MGQAQRRDREYVPQDRREDPRTEYAAERRRRQSTAGNRAASSRRNGSGKDISVIVGTASRSRADSAQGSKRKGSGNTGGSKNRDGLEDLELWELSNDDGDTRLMRLADREQVRSKQRPSRTISYSDNWNTGRSYSGRRSAGSSRPISAVKRRKARKRKLALYRLFALFMIGVCLVLIYQTTGAIYRMVHREKVEKNKGIVDVVSDKIYGREITPPEIIEDFLEINDYSRPGDKIGKVKNVFVHYTANPGTSAAQNRSYFANLAQTQERSASAHFIIGYEGELIQCIPLNEQAYAVATRNNDSVSIECCYLDEDGKFTQETYDTLVHTLAWLAQEYKLSAKDILRHYDCGGKKCPLYYVEHEDAWEKLLADVEAYRKSPQ